MDVSYCTREDVLNLFDVSPTVSVFRAIDREIKSGAIQVNSLCRRKRLWPLLGTVYKDFPNMQSANVGRLWLDDDTLISLTSAVPPLPRSLPVQLPSTPLLLPACLDIVTTLSQQASLTTLAESARLTLCWRLRPMLA
jgi:hypothetical protein